MFKEPTADHTRMVTNVKKIYLQFSGGRQDTTINVESKMSVWEKEEHKRVDSMLDFWCSVLNVTYQNTCSD